MAKFPVRIALGILTLRLFGAPASAANDLDWSRQGKPGERHFEDAALAPAAGGMTRGFDGIRAELARRYESELAVPRYAGEGDTSIHRAIREVELLLKEGKSLEALLLSDELLGDLLRAQESQRSDVLTNKWNGRYPSELQVDVIGEAHVTQMLAYLEQLWEVLDDPTGSEFLHQIWSLLSREVSAATRESGYTSGVEMVIDYMDALDVGTPFEVHIPKAFEELLGQRSPLAIVVTGLPMVVGIVWELENRHAPLRDAEWMLKIDGGDFKSGYQFVLPNQKLELVIRGAA